MVFFLYFCNSLGYIDSVGNREFPLFVMQNIQSSGVCIAICTDFKFAYAGLQAGNECFCSNDYGNLYGEDPGGCNMNCNDGSVCGDNERNSVYRTYVSPSSIPSFANVQYVGCWEDREARDMPYYAGSHVSLHGKSCFSLALFVIGIYYLWCMLMKLSLKNKRMYFALSKSWLVFCRVASWIRMLL